MLGGARNPKWEDVEQAMAACLELPEEQRSADPAQQSASVRGEVESLLAAYGRSGGFLGGETRSSGRLRFLGPGAPRRTHFHHLALAGVE